MKYNETEPNESKLQETSILLSTVCKLTMVGTWEVEIINNSGDPLDARNLSEEACFITGYRMASESAFDYFQRTIPDHDQENMRRSFFEAIKRKSVYSITHRIVRKGMSDRLMYQRGQIFPDTPNKSARKMLCVCCDITEFKASTDNNQDEPAFISSHSFPIRIGSFIGIQNRPHKPSVNFLGSEKIKDLLRMIGEQAKYLDDAVSELNSLITPTKDTEFTNNVSLKVRELVLIDDEPLANKIHSLLIGSVDKTVPVITFTDPTEGMQYLKKQGSEALVLLDINMPVMNAWDCLRFIQLHNIKTKVIILSSSINPNDEKKAAEFSSVVGFLNKPLTKPNIEWVLNELNPPLS